MRYIIGLFILTWWSCRSSQVQKAPELTCAGFDIRQCQTDRFAKEVLEYGTRSEREDQMTEWLRSEKINTLAIRLELDHYEVVCEACDMCPTPDRYFIKVDGPIPELAGLRLLNFTLIDCDLYPEG